MCIGRRDVAKATPLLSPHVVYRVPGHHVLAGSFSGIDEVVTHLMALADRSGGTFNAFKFEDWLVGENDVAVVVDAHMQGHGATLTERIIFLFGFDGSDHINEISVFFQNEDSIERFFGP